MKTAAEMTVSEFEKHLKAMRDDVFILPVHHDVNGRWRQPKWRSAVIGRATARRGAQQTPLIAMHTRRAMQRRRTK